MTIQPSYFFPYFQLKYYEYSNQVDKTSELLSDLVIIDGLFFSANDTNKFSLGFQSNIDRTATTKAYLSQLGYGIGFSRNEDDQLFVKSLTQLSVYLVLSADPTNQIHLEPGESKMLYDMGPYIRNVQLPPKKKKTLNLNDLTIRVSFGERFTDLMSSNADEATNNGLTANSPCWVQLTLDKFIDINILRSI